MFHDPYVKEAYATEQWIGLKCIQLNLDDIFRTENSNKSDGRQLQAQQ